MRITSRLPLIVVVLLTSHVSGLDYVALNREGAPRHIMGRTLTEAQDGGLLLMDRELIVWAIQPDERARFDRDDKPFEPMRGAELRERVLDQLPDGFSVYSTAHYLICHNTSPAYAQWCGSLYEGLYRAFHNYWKRRGLDLAEPDAPLVAFVFDKQSSYARYAQTELGEATENIVGYYSLRTNRVSMYDLTGMHGLRGAGGRLTTTAQINRLLMQPGAERMVATIVHEATHQLAYNCGLHQRYADIPLCVSEGLAVFFETPDLRSSTGWSTIGAVNRYRYDRFRQFISRRTQNSLETLISADDRFRQADSALDAYAEAWALNYYLIQRRPKDYIAYLRVMAEKSPLVYDTPQERLQTFTDIFGDDLIGLGDELVRMAQFGLR